MIGSFATFPFSLAWPSRAGQRVGRARRRPLVWTPAHQAPAGAAAAGAVARVPAVDGASAWTTEEQQFLRALRESGL